MTNVLLDGHYGRSLSIDFCQACQAFWFDGLESVQLAPVSVLRLFRIVGEAGGAARAQFSAGAACPHCRLPLVATYDQQRQSRFEYRRCPSDHGRLISFFNFLREKDFIKPLSKAQLDDLRLHLEAVNCSNCGAPIDLAKATACGHCGSPLSILDVRRAGGLVAELRGESAQAAAPDVEAAFAAFEREPRWYDDASRGGLVNAAIGAFARWWVDR